MAVSDTLRTLVGSMNRTGLLISSSTVDVKAFIGPKLP